MMKIAPTKDSMVALRAADPRLVETEGAVTKAEEALKRARAETNRLDEEAGRLPAAIAKGRATASELSAVLQARSAAALQVAPAEWALADAQAKMAPAIQAALQALTRHLKERRERLARDLGSAKVKELSSFVEAEREILNAAASIVDMFTGRELLDASALGPYLSWPMSVQDQNQLAGAALLASPSPTDLAKLHHPPARV